MNSFRELLEEDARTKMSDEFIQFHGKELFEENPVCATYEYLVGCARKCPDGTMKYYVCINEFRETLADLGQLDKGNTGGVLYIGVVKKG